MQDTRLVYAEALKREFRIGWKVQEIKNTSTFPGAVALAKVLLAQWAAEKRKC